MAEEHQKLCATSNSSANSKNTIYASDENSFDAFWQDIDQSKSHQDEGMQKTESPDSRQLAHEKQRSSSPEIINNSSIINSSTTPSKYGTKCGPNHEHRRREAQHLISTTKAERQSGVNGFSALLNRQHQLLLRVVGVENDFDDFARPVVRLECAPVADAKTPRLPLQPKRLLNVVLRDSWAVETPNLQRGQIVRLIEPRKRGENEYEIGDSHGPTRSSDSTTAGLLIVEPETLISSTQLAQAHYCQRKALFQDRFRASGTTLPMIVGTIAHELFQIALQQHPPGLSAEWLFRVYRRRFLTAICLDLIAMQCSLERFEEELRLYLDNIAQWIRAHVPPPHSSTGHNSHSQKHHGCKPMAEVRPENGDQNAPTQHFYYLRTRDIEENVWTPTIGVKGRIDVSFLGAARPSSTSQNGNLSPELVIPLELKTGKSYGTAGSIEHHTQVMLYTLMFSERANNGRIGPGFLLYMRDNSVAQVHPKSVQLRGLVQMRNQLAAHFSKFELESLPDPLTNPRSCNFCPYATLCGMFALGRNSQGEEKRPSTSEGTKWRRISEEIIVLDKPAAEMVDENGENKENIERMATELAEKGHRGKSTNPSPSNGNSPPLSEDMAAFFAHSTAHLNQLEVDYARDWIRRCLRAWGDAWERGSTLRLFRQSPVERELHGVCMAHLQLVSSMRKEEKGANNDKDGNSFLLSFTRKTSGTKLPALLQPGSTVTISTDTEYALAIGTVHSIDEDESAQRITVVADRQLPPPSSTTDEPLSFHLDKHDGFTSHALALGNIAALIENTPNAKRLRSILTTGTSSSSSSSIIADQDDDNCAIEEVEFVDDKIWPAAKMAILRVLRLPDYALIRTSSRESILSVLAVFIRSFLQLGKSILFCANSHAYVDDLLLRLKPHVTPEQLLRIGSNRSTPEALKGLQLDNKLAAATGSSDGNSALESDAPAKALYRRAQTLVEQKPILVASTVSAVPSNVFFAASSRRFDYCFLMPADATFALPDSQLCAPLLRAHKFVLFACEQDEEDRRKKNGNRSRNEHIPLMERLKSLMLQQEGNGQKRIINLTGFAEEQTKKGGSEVERGNERKKKKMGSMEMMMEEEPVKKKAKGMEEKKGMGKAGKGMTASKRTTTTLTLFDCWRRMGQPKNAGGGGNAAGKK